MKNSNIPKLLKNKSHHIKHNFNRNKNHTFRKKNALKIPKKLSHKNKIKKYKNITQKRKLFTGGAPDPIEQLVAGLDAARAARQAAAATAISPPPLPSDSRIDADSEKDAAEKAALTAQLQLDLDRASTPIDTGFEEDAAPATADPLAAAPATADASTTTGTGDLGTASPTTAAAAARTSSRDASPTTASPTTPAARTNTGAAALGTASPTSASPATASNSGVAGPPGPPGPAGPRGPPGQPLVKKGISKKDRDRLIGAAQRTIDDIEKSLKDAVRTLADLQSLPLETDSSPETPPPNINPKQYTIGLILPANTEFYNLPPSGVSPETFFADILGTNIQRPLHFSSMAGTATQGISTIGDPSSSATASTALPTSGSPIVNIPTTAAPAAPTLPPQQPPPSPIPELAPSASQSNIIDAPTEQGAVEQAAAQSLTSQSKSSPLLIPFSQHKMTPIPRL